MLVTLSRWKACNMTSSGFLVPNPCVRSHFAMATHAVPTHALAAETVPAPTRPATIDAPAPVTTVAARTPIPSCTSSCAGSSSGSPDRRTYRNLSAKDLAALTEREQLWLEQGITEETRVFADLLYCNNMDGVTRASSPRWLRGFPRRTRPQGYC